MKYSLELALNGINIKDIFVGIECNVEGATFHLINRDNLLILYGKFNSLSNTNVMLDTLFNTSNLSVKYRNNRIIAFNTTGYFLKKYKILMRDKKLSYISKNLSIKKVLPNAFICTPMDAYISGFEPIAFFDETFNLIKEPGIATSCTVMLKDLKNFKYSDIDKAYEV